MSADAIDSQFFVGYEFKKALLAVQQAIVCYLFGCEVVRDLSDKDLGLHKEGRKWVC